MTLDSIGVYQLKFFKGAGWGGGEWTGDPNRELMSARRVGSSPTKGNFLYYLKFKKLFFFTNFQKIFRL